jgi:hypothetical protein
MRVCSLCQTRTMVRQIEAGEVSFICACGNRENGSGADRLIESGGGKRTGQTQKFETLVKCAPRARETLRVAEPCPKCDTPFTTVLRLGEEMTGIRTCSCGFIENLK